MVASSSSVFKHDLEQFHIDFPGIESRHCRNDNAGCYSGASAIIAKKEICDSGGIKLEKIDFNEAQKGKDQCDRDGAVAKRKICTYINKGHDVTNAAEVNEAVDAPPGVLKNSKLCVIGIDYKNSRLDKIKMKDVSRYHYFQFEEMGHIRQIFMSRAKSTTATTARTPEKGFGVQTVIARLSSELIWRY